MMGLEDGPSSLEPEPRKEPERVPMGSQSIRNLILKYAEEYLSAGTNTKKYMVLEGLIALCTDYIKNDTVRESILYKLKARELNLASDFLNIYKDHARTTGWEIILENEYRKLLPEVRDIWFVVQKAIVDQGLLPWAFPDPKAELRERMFATVIEEIVTKAGGVPRAAQSPSPDVVPKIPIEELPPWVENELPDIDKLDKAKLVDGLLTRATDEDYTPTKDGDILPPHPDEEKGDEVTDQELEEAARIWGSALKRRAKRFE